MKNILLHDFNDEATYPIDNSLLGGNSYYLEFCNAGGHRPAYAACLNRINDIKQGKSLGMNCTDCSSAIGGRTCPAMAMREEEIEAGRALYYTNRSKLQDHNERRLRTLGIRINREPLKKLMHAALADTAPKVPTATTTYAGSDYAEAINKAVAAEAAKATSHPSTATVSSDYSVSADLIEKAEMAAKPSVKPIRKFESGLSLAQIAEQMRAKA